MKKTLIAMTLLAGAVSVYSQGYIMMGNYNSDLFYMQVYGPEFGGTVEVVDGPYYGFETMGNSSYGVNPNPPTQPYGTYNGAPGTTVYSSSPINGTGYDVGLLGVLGTVSAGNYGALSLSTSSVLTGLGTAIGVGPGAAGSWAAVSAAIIPGTGNVYTIAVAAWANTGPAGAANTLLAAQQMGYEWGVSDMITTTLSTGYFPPPESLWLDGAYGTGANELQSFSLVPGIYDYDVIPEPGTIALGVMGASALLFRRRQ
jgi:hypothetical protein